MENLGVNILNSEEFCSDIVALFFDHLWNCKDCFSKIFVSLVVFFLIVFTLFILYNMFVDWFEKRLDRLKYRRENSTLCIDLEELRSDYADLSDKFNELAYEHTVLLDQHKELQKEYYHTCN